MKAKGKINPGPPDGANSALIGAHNVHLRVFKGHF
jgi:hypothetical protein